APTPISRTNMDREKECRYAATRPKAGNWRCLRAMICGGGRAVRAARSEGAMVTRREFLDAMAVGAAGLAVGTTAKSYVRIVGAKDRLNVAVIGLNGRGYAHLSSLEAE